MNFNSVDFTSMKLALEPSVSSLTQQPSTFYVALCSVGVLLAASSFYTPHRRMKGPPGPPGLPIVGNLFDLPRETPWVGLTEMAKTWGPIFSLKIFAANIIVIDDAEVAVELFETRSKIYSSRKLARYADYATNSLSMFLMKYTPDFLRMRRAAHAGLTPKAVEEYEPLQEFEAKKMVLEILKAPKDRDSHVKRHAAVASITSVYSIPSAEVDDSLIKRIHTIIDRLILGVIVGRYWVDFIPLLDHLPIWMSSWKKQGIKVYKEDTANFLDLLNGVKQSVIDGTRKASFTSRLVEDQSKSGLSDVEIAWISATVFLGGSDTTASSINMFIRAMALNPDVQKKAQAELDAVVGRDRMPTFADRPFLPYISAIVKETQRFAPVVPIANHATSEDDVYNGYFIPKGSMVWGNIWSMNRGKSYINPEAFRPERFLDEGVDFAIPHGTKEFGHFSFGFGRRICLGRHFASASLYIDAAVLLWAFNFSKALDENGKEIDIDPTATSGSGGSVGPADFKCTITPRIPNLEDIVGLNLE